MIRLAMTPEEELAQLEAQTRRMFAENGASWLESEPWEILPGMHVSCCIKTKTLSGRTHGPKRVWHLNWHPIGHNALLGVFWCFTHGRRLSSFTVARYSLSEVVQ